MNGSHEGSKFILKSRLRFLRSPICPVTFFLSEFAPPIFFVFFPNLVRGTLLLGKVYLGENCPSLKDILESDRVLYGFAPVSH